jgi:hypothetical protein
MGPVEAIAVACFGLLILLGPLLALVLLGRWILGPLDRAARRRKGPTQFTVVDFLCLVFLIQLPLALIQATLMRGAMPELAAGRILLVVACVIGGLMWWISVKQLSGAGITRTSHRCIFLAFVLPVAFFGSIAMMILVAYLIAELSSPFGARPEALWPVPVMGALAIAFSGAASYTRWIVRQSEAHAEVSPGTPGEG